MVFTLESDVDYAEKDKRVLFSMNNQEKINSTVDVQTSEGCFTWKAYLRVRITCCFCESTVLAADAYVVTKSRMRKLTIPPIRNRITEMQTIETN